MYMTNDLARAHQQALLASATEQRLALRVRALGRATRRAQRAQSRLASARHEAFRLRAALAMEQDL